MICELSLKHLEKAKYIWSECFDDTAEFIEWYFSDIFDRGYGYFVEDELVSIICVSKRMMHVRGREVPCAVIQGVSTLPEHRKKGYAEQLMNHAIAELRKEYPIAMLTTYIPKQYEKSGFITYLRTGLCDVSECADEKAVCVEAFSEKDAEELAGLLYEQLNECSGWLTRNNCDFIKKHTDQTKYGSDKLYKTYKDNALVGYAFASECDGEFVISEKVGECGKLTEGKCKAMATKEDGDLYSMIRILDFEKAFESVSIPPRELTLFVFDSVIKENNKAWHLYSSKGRTRIVETAADPESELTVNEVSAIFIGAIEGMEERFSMYFEKRAQLESY